MKKVLIAFIFLISGVSLRSQVTITAGSALLQEPGSEIRIPVKVSGLDASNGGTAVSGMEFYISYSGSCVTYDTTISFSTLTPQIQWFFSGNGIEYATNWLEPQGNTLSIPDNTVLFEIVFQYSGGYTDLAFDTLRCLLTDSAYEAIPGVVYVNGVITPGAGSDDSRWNGTGPWNTVSNWSNGIPGDSTVAIVETGEVILSSNASCREITINPGSVLSIGPGSSLTIHHDYINNGTFNLQSDESGSGSLIVNGAVSGTGINHFHRYLDFPGSHFISSPVLNATASVFGSNNAEKYVEDNFSWKILSPGDVLSSGYGYRVTGTDAGTVDFQGSFPSGDVSPGGLSYTGSLPADTRGLNLAGNPFPSAIFADLRQWTKSGVDNAVYVWDNYKYICWNGIIGSLTGGIIPAMQSFFIQSNATGSSVIIPSGSRLHSNLPYYKETSTVQNMLSVKIEGSEGYFDQAYVNIQSGSTDAYDGSFDAFKLPGLPEYPQIWTQASDQNILSINTQPGFTSIPVEISTENAGSYSISFSNMESFNSDQPLFFEDKTAPATFNIRSVPQYVFLSNGGTETGRFVLHFQTIGINDNPSEGGISIRQEGNRINITSGKGISHYDRIRFFSMTGQCVFTSGQGELPAFFPSGNLKPGLCLVVLESGDKVITRKLFIR